MYYCFGHENRRILLFRIYTVMPSSQRTNGFTFGAKPLNALGYGFHRNLYKANTLVRKKTQICFIINLYMIENTKEDLMSTIIRPSSADHLLCRLRF